MSLNSLFGPLYCLLELCIVFWGTPTGMIVIDGAAIPPMVVLSLRPPAVWCGEVCSWQRPTDETMVQGEGALADADANRPHSGMAGREAPADSQLIT